MCGGNDNCFSAFESLDGGVWPYADTLTFVPDTLRDSIARGTMILFVRHTASYGYSNLWLELSYNTDDSTTVRDTVDVILADRFGNRLGHGMGSSFGITDTISRNFELMQGRPVYLRHIMRADTITEIEQVGVIFNPHNGYEHR